jgi:hypothetical protein
METQHLSSTVCALRHQSPLPLVARQAVGLDPVSSALEFDDRHLNLMSGWIATSNGSKDSHFYAEP